MLDNLPEFDELLALAQSNPQALDDLLKDQVDHLIESAPKSYQRRLRGLQFQIDSHRRLSKNSLESCVKISEMMQDSLLELNAALNYGTDNPKTANQSAKLLTLREA